MFFYAIAHLGRNDEILKRGVATVMNKTIRKAMIEYAPVNETIMRVRYEAIQGKLYITIIQCYAPTNEADDEEKNDFYLSLQSEKRTKT